MFLSTPPIYDSRDLRYKDPYGAVAAGTKVRFTVRPTRAEGFSHVTLYARLEFDHDRTVSVVMPWIDTDFVTDVFTGELDTGSYIGLIWYTFHLEALDGRCCDLGPYQLTVYDGADKVPDWFGAGMCYQIFPDRFSRTKVPDPAGLVGDRRVHENWDEMPLYQPMGKTRQGQDIYNRDFFGGNLKGVEEKLDYIASLGVETIYFCPIFEGSENHRYGTADYSRVDPMLGENEDFTHLCEEAHRRGMKVMLDGVFNHTGYVSRYFNGDGFYDTVGASQSQESPYYDWFSWKHWPDSYESWWGIYSLPAVNKWNEGYRNFIFDDKDSVIRRWLRAGADAWRLDVADELPDDFVRGIHEAAREENPDAFVLGEVWEDGSTKIAYGVRRKHLLGNHLDGLMNYPFRTALLKFLLGDTGVQFRDSMETLRENYPKSAFYSAMNALGTHDTLRVLTYLGVGSERRDQTRDWRAAYQMTDSEHKRGCALLKLGAIVLFAFPGAPTIFYGDEAGMTGFEDPFNRQTYPWGREDQELVAYFKRLGNFRKRCQPLRRGDLRWGTCGKRVLSFARALDGDEAAAAVNPGLETETVVLPWENRAARDILSGQVYQAEKGELRLTLPPGCGILVESV